MSDPARARFRYPSAALRPPCVKLAALPCQACAATSKYLQSILHIEATDAHRVKGKETEGTTRGYSTYSGKVWQDGNIRDMTRRENCGHA